MPTSDEAAIAHLHQAFAAQKAAFVRCLYPSIDERRGHIAALIRMITSHRARIKEALRADFSVHPEAFSDLAEVLGVVTRAMYAAENVAVWAADEERFTDPSIFGSARATIRRRPKGVIGNIVPWNFPFDLSLGPLVEMLAAGNRAIMKPSEYTPACGEVLREMIAATFAPDHVTVVAGGVDLARAFCNMRWDHLLYTGSPAIGREVAKAAAQNLVPVTLELGGKSPVLLHDDAITAENVAQILGAKAIKNGQMCISTDYCLVPRARVPDFVRHARAHMLERMPGYSRSDDCAGIISERHLDRLVGMLAEARTRGCEVITLENDAQVDRATRRMPLSLVLDPPEDLALMQEEIFGPILPIKSYDSLNEAIDYVNGRERPLALYVFAADEQVAEDILGRTISGGACINACAAHGAVPSLGFGGIGESGTGRHHGIDGFREFSNPRGVFVRGKGDLFDAFTPPYGEMANQIADFALGPKS
ncbi:aldehyde dehydrogenase family protein [Pendulispora rubella]|uniref:Aldehyde dehydrogenase n=1 Tax=Pendulispora rubella TaxID=2741070 RepID=A0ABZ2L7G3_9BACT